MFNCNCIVISPRNSYILKLSRGICNTESYQKKVVIVFSVIYYSIGKLVKKVKSSHVKK